MHFDGLLSLMADTTPGMETTSKSAPEVTRTRSSSPTKKAPPLKVQTKPNAFNPVSFAAPAICANASAPESPVSYQISVDAVPNSHTAPLIATTRNRSSSRSVADAKFSPGRLVASASADHSNRFPFRSEMIV